MSLACKSEAVLKYCDLLAELGKVKQENELLKQKIKEPDFKPLSLVDQKYRSKDAILNYSGMSLNEQLIRYKSEGRIIQFPPWYLESVPLVISDDRTEARRLVEKSQELLFVYYDILWCILHNVKKYVINNEPWTFSFIEMDKSLKVIFPSLNIKTIYVSKSINCYVLRYDNPRDHFDTILSCTITWT